jgi:esterase/lipase superfamily enzyme
MRLLRTERQERDDFFSEIHAAMQAARESGETPHALFFLHGYNVTFEDAAIRAAQIGFDLEVPGATAFFSWPSRGSVAAYPADEATIEASQQAITDFLVDFTENCSAEKVHVIAHSMGNRGLFRALQRIAANVEMEGKVEFGQVFLAAPDVDRDLFLDLARLYPEHTERTTLYASDGDLPVHLSTELHEAPRAAITRPVPWRRVWTPWWCRTLTMICWGTPTSPKRRRCCTTSTTSCATTRRRASGSGSRPRFTRGQLSGS